MTSLQDTNIIKACCSATSLKRNGIYLSTLDIGSFSDKRKWDTLLEEAKTHGCTKAIALLDREDVKKDVATLQDLVSSKKPRLREIQSEVCRDFKGAVNAQGIGIASIASAEISKAKRKANADNAQKAIDEHMSLVKPMLASEDLIVDYEVIMIRLIKATKYTSPNADADE
jgi:hypothetical protein